MEAERRDLRVDYLSSIDWFCLDGLYVIKVVAIVAISGDDAEARIILTFNDITQVSRWCKRTIYLINHVRALMIIVMQNLRTEKLLVERGSQYLAEGIITVDTLREIIRTTCQLFLNQ